MKVAYKLGKEMNRLKSAADALKDVRMTMYSRENMSFDTCGFNKVSQIKTSLIALDCELSHGNVFSADKGTKELSDIQSSLLDDALELIAFLNDKCYANKK